MLSRIRAYFAASGAIEVRTPVIAQHASSEPTLRNLEIAREHGPRFLRTSPEAALKGLLAAGAGDLYELGPAFRAEEAGRLHREEFTLLEWYRVGIDHHGLMDDVIGLLAACGYQGAPSRLTYKALFETVYGIDPHAIGSAEMLALVRAGGLEPPAGARDDRAFLFDALYALGLERQLARQGAVLLHGFPAELRAYARLETTSPQAAERFELVIDGIELANGYHEIVDPAEQAACFERENALRARRGLDPVVIDERWLAALRRGLPACAGVALGVERLLMILEGASDIASVAPA